jgi:hypothetical protein
LLAVALSAGQPTADFFQLFEFSRTEEICIMSFFETIPRDEQKQEILRDLQHAATGGVAVRATSRPEFGPLSVQELATRWRVGVELITSLLDELQAAGLAEVAETSGSIRNVRWRAVEQG